MSGNSIRDLLTGRWPERFNRIPWMEAPKGALDRALMAGERVRDQYSKIQADPKLSPLGKQDALRTWIATAGVASSVYAARKAIHTMRAKLAAERAKLQPTIPTDRADVNSAVQKSELRGMLRAMKSPMQRLTLLLSDDADPLMVSAVLEASPVMSGLTKDALKQISDSAIERFHPGAAARFDDFSEAIDLVEAAYSTTIATIEKAADFPSPKILQDFLESAVPQRAGYDSAAAALFADFGNLATAGPVEQSAEAA